jgi:cobaltochelatase CobS
LIDAMIRVAGALRKLFINEEQGQPCEITVTTRSLLRWAYLAQRYEPISGIGLSPLEYAADLAFANRASKPTKTMIHELIQRIFNETDKEK